jgi:hypothetical protein
MTVNQQQSFENFELGQTKVGRHHSLGALLAAHPHAHVGHLKSKINFVTIARPTSQATTNLNHGHIVGTITDRQRTHTQLLLDDFDEKRLL